MILSGGCSTGIYLCPFQTQYSSRPSKETWLMNVELLIQAKITCLFSFISRGNHKKYPLRYIWKSFNHICILKIYIKINPVSLWYNVLSPCPQTDCNKSKRHHTHLTWFYSLSTSCMWLWMTRWNTGKWGTTCTYCHLFYAYFTCETVETCTYEMTPRINLRTFESPLLSWAITLDHDLDH